jgi:putative effector of murein hydrolase
MIEKGVAANAVIVMPATLITWMLTGDLAADFDTIFMRNILVTAVLVLVVSMIVGLVFAHHKKCT